MEFRSKVHFRRGTGLLLHGPSSTVMFRCSSHFDIKTRASYSSSLLTIYEIQSEQAIAPVGRAAIATVGRSCSTMLLRNGSANATKPATTPFRYRDRPFRYRARRFRYRDQSFRLGHQTGHDRPESVGTMDRNTQKSAWILQYPSVRKFSAYCSGRLWPASEGRSQSRQERWKRRDLERLTTT